MKLVQISLVVLLFCCAAGAVAQSERRISVGDSEIVLTIWDGGRTAGTAVLLVPGWSGGPTDQLGIGEYLSAHGVSVFVLSPRGWHGSSGTATFANALEDIGAALAWARSAARGRVLLGGHSWGGGISLAYAARDTSVRRVFSIAGTDHGIFIRQCQRDPAYAATIEQVLESTAAPSGPIRFDVSATLDELAHGQSTYGLIENARKLSDRSILLIGGWEDESVTIDETLLPLYRALKTAGAGKVTFLTYHAGHSFSGVRTAMHQDLLEWLER